MNLDIINELENKINRAIEIIADLRTNKQKIEKENETLTRQLETLQNKFDKYKKDAELRITEVSNSKPDFDIDEVKSKLSKLAGKLAALEDSWT